MSIGERIKKVREYYDLTQSEFSKSINIGQSTLAMLESGSREVNDRHISLISLTYDVNENWLKNGEGEMLIANSHEERFAINLAKLQRCNDETIIRWANAIAETNPEFLRQIESFMKLILNIDDQKTD